MSEGLDVAKTTSFTVAYRRSEARARESETRNHLLPARVARGAGRALKGL